MSDSTGSMWLRMLGLEDLWKTANSPDFQQQISTLVAAILETRIRVERIEFKLDALLDKLGHDDIARRAPLSLTGFPGNGSGSLAGTFTAASAVADARGGDAAAEVDGAGGGTAGAGGGRQPTDWRPYGLDR